MQHWTLSLSSDSGAYPVTVLTSSPTFKTGSKRTANWELRGIRIRRNGQFVAPLLFRNRRVL